MQQRKMDRYVKTVHHSLPEKVTEHLWKDQEILVITLQTKKHKEATKKNDPLKNVQLPDKCWETR